MTARATERGLTTVEFAIVGLIFFVILFAVIEFGRIIYTMNILQEGARRGARVAAICAVNDPAIANRALFTGLPGLTTSNVRVEYLNQAGAVTGTFTDIHYVRVRIADYAMPIAIPLINPTFQAPEFSSTLPRESLGVVKSGAAPGC
jgi:hypothetical protein